MSDPAFLHVDRSATGRRWEGPDPRTERLGAAIAQAASLPEIVGRVLAARGVAPHEAQAHLAPTLRDLMPDPSRLRDMDAAAARIHRAARRGERIAVFADYDVDGGASAALILTWLRAQGRDATLYVPDRIDEGYGPNVPAMAALGRAHDLIICVDCGTLSHEPVAAAACDVIVLDHHQAAATLPAALAVVNPNRQDETGELGHLCAAGVVFLTLVAVNRLMRAEGAPGPDLMPLLDLVALATVADVAPLVGLNRAFVRQGLALMRGRLRPGVAALAEAAGLVTAPGVHSLGFVLGPRVNAGGRVGAADLGARLLATADPHEAAALAERLDQLNLERKAIEAEVLARALAAAEANGVDGPLVWAAGDGWHPGVVGIVAARLKEAFGRPALVVGFAGEAGKGSGRSIAGVDLGAAVARLAAEGLIEKGGGHRMAAGVSLARGQLAPAMERLAALVARAAAAPETGRPLRVTGLVPPAADLALAEAILAAGPYGAEAPAPRVVVAEARLAGLRRMAGGHLGLTLADGAARLDAVAFRAAEGPLGAFLAAAVGARVHLAGRLELDDWGGRRRVKLHIEDAAPAGGAAA
ncbi:single-stranded-DNA-specific exonuclease RecJ [Amaricoccus sp.]|uniref:single-stranded-DNA-specific exonuclease RecJ n=1 Tax=Amaricoccus sp. TaxID=1872485 RepID=UPI001B406D4E|nr:single-stranded-DNA-specific exonuclease RecJ [Amaricoccus sp.]MBP7000480.1 single-stranded-DNA-specific exonuclease RecJ [Amaricoccus sp.]